MKIPITISLDVEVAEMLKNRFGRGRVSTYVQDLINADMVQIDGRGEEDNYARLVGILRQAWFQMNSWSAFHEHLSKIDKDWSNPTSAYHYLHSSLQELKEDDKIKELVTKWLRHANYDESEIKELLVGI